MSATMRLVCVCVVVILVQQSSGYLKPEPPETHFFLKKNYQHQQWSDLSSVYFTESSSTKAEMLCIGLEEYHGWEVEMLAHQICTEANFDSFSSVRKSETQMMESSGLSCRVDFAQQVLCSRQSLGPERRRCHPVEVLCGPCHHKILATPGSHHTFWSPMYPVLLPGLVCTYEVEVVHPHLQADLGLEVTDLSVGSEGMESCQGASSSIHVLTGSQAERLQLSSVLCGASSEQREFKYENKKIIQLLFFSGGGREREERRGFQLTVSVSREKKLTNSLTIGLIVSFLSAFVLLCGLLCCVAAVVSKKKSGAGRLAGRPRRGQKTANPYVMDNSMARRQASLPGFTFYCDSSGQLNREVRNQELGFKLYETISLQSRLNTYENVGSKRLDYRSRRSSPGLPAPPERPASVPESSELSHIYLSVSGENDEVFEE